MTKLITNCDKEWLYWAELFALLWPKMTLGELAEMADRILYTFGEQNSTDFIGHK